MCIRKEKKESFFQLQVISTLSEITAQFGTWHAFNMSEKLPQELRAIMYRNAIAGHTQIESRVKGY